MYERNFDHTLHLDANNEVIMTWATTIGGCGARCLGPLREELIDQVPVMLWDQLQEWLDQQAESLLCREHCGAGLDLGIRRTKG